MHTAEAWLVLYLRWTRFPWNQYLRTSIAITSGPSFAVDLPRTNKNATVLNYFSPQITFAMPQYPQYELMVQIHHRSNVVDFGKGGTPDPGWQFLTTGVLIASSLNAASRPGKRFLEGIAGSSVSSLK